MGSQDASWGAVQSCLETEFGGQLDRVERRIQERLALS
jgi:hypothetical protein